MNTEGFKMDKRKISNAFNQYTDKAKKYINDSAGIKNLMNKLDDKMESMPQVGPVWDNLKSMVAMLGAYARKEYTDVPVRTIAAIIGALLYIINPIDVMMDVIPVVGLADDIIVIVLAYNIAKADVEKYNKWLLENGKIDIDIEFQDQDAASTAYENLGEDVKKTVEDIFVEAPHAEVDETTEIKFD